MIKRLNAKLVILLLSALAVVVVKVLFIVRTGDVGWEPDSYMHFLELRQIFTDFPNNLELGLGVWTKPLYAYPIGLFVTLTGISTLAGVQLLNIFLWLLVGLITFAICRKVGMRFVWSWLAFILTQISFLGFRTSVTVLTEPIFALVLVLAVYAALTRRWPLALLLVGIGVLGRLEGLFFVGFFGVFALLDTKRSGWWKLGLLGFAPVVVWNFLGFLNTGKPLFIFQQGYPTTAGAYGFGSPIHYLLGLTTQEPLLVLFAALMIVFMLAKWRDYKLSHPAVFLSSCVITFGALQSVLWTFGLFGTAGLLRYFVAIVPLAAILAAMALQYLLRRERLRTVVLAVAVIISIQSMFTLQELRSARFFSGLWSYPVVEEELKTAASWVKQNLPVTEHLYTVRPEVAYYAGRTLENSSINLNRAKLGRAGVYVWTTTWGPSVGVEQKYFASAELLFNQGETFIYRIP